MRGWICRGLMAVALAMSAFVPAPAAASDWPSNAELAAELRATEEAFAATMAGRDHSGFASFLAQETVFFGAAGEIRGRDAVAADWRRFFDGPVAPFSWNPDAVAVLDSGTLGLTSGPVLDPEGRRIGTFNSVWRRESDGTWKIVFDRGCPACECPPPDARPSETSGERGPGGRPAASPRRPRPPARASAPR